MINSEEGDSYVYHYNVAVVQNPTISLEDDVNATKELLSWRGNLSFSSDTPTVAW